MRAGVASTIGGLPSPAACARSFEEEPRLTRTALSWTIEPCYPDGWDVTIVFEERRRRATFTGSLGHFVLALVMLGLIGVLALVGQLNLALVFIGALMALLVSGADRERGVVTTQRLRIRRTFLELGDRRLGVATLTGARVLVVSGERVLTLFGADGGQYPWLQLAPGLAAEPLLEPLRQVLRRERGSAREVPQELRALDQRGVHRWT